MAEGITNLAQDKADLGGVGLLRRLAQIGVEGGEQGGLVGEESVLELAELGAAVIERPRGAGIKVFALASNKSGVVHIPVGEVSVIV
jgi:hypothetical protein